MAKYIDAEKLAKAIEDKGFNCSFALKMERLDTLALIDSLQHEQPDNIIQWTGKNLKEVIGFTGKSKKFDEWFKSWDEYENYVHTHNDILKLFCEDGSHYEVPVGAWIVKTPDGYNLPSVAKYIQQEQPEMDLEKEIKEHSIQMPMSEFTHDREAEEFIEWAKKEFRHFYELGLNARKV